MAKRKNAGTPTRPGPMDGVDMEAVLELPPDDPANMFSPRILYAKMHESLTEAEKAAIDARYPGGFTARDEANALVALTLRNGPPEALHAADARALPPDNGAGRVSQEEMKSIMIAAAENMERLLRMREERPIRYFDLIFTTNYQRCEAWGR